MGVYGSSDYYSIEQNANEYEKNMVYCERCGVRFHKTNKKCPQCNKRHSQRFYNKWWFWSFIVIIIFAYFPINNFNTINNDVNYDLNYNSETKQIEVSEDEYKASCITLNYVDIARNPNEYTGENAVFRGQVIQVQEDDNEIVLRVNVTQGQYGFWDDTIYVEYNRKSKNESRILEGDIVMIYGQMNGIMNYQAVLGNQVSIPYLIAEFIDIT